MHLIMDYSSILSTFLTVMPLLTAGGALVCGVMLHWRCAGSLPRLIMGFSCFAWFFVETAFLYFLMHGDMLQSPEVRFHPSFLILTAIATKISLLDPFALLNPGRVLWKRMFKYVAPFAVLCLVYTAYVLLAPVQLHSDALYNMAKGIALGATDAVEFSLRCVLILYLALDLGFSVVKLWRFVPLYNKMLDENFSSVEYYDISWVKHVTIPALFVIFLFVLYITIPGEIISYVLGGTHLLLLSAVLFYTADSALFMNEVSPSLFPHLHWSYRTFSWKVPVADKGEENTVLDVQEQFLTDQQIVAYKQVFEEWMSVTKPYTKSEFRVSDVHKKLGLGRLETNEFFNRSYHCYFRNLVQRYRIEESIRMMKEYPDKQIKEISYEVGFSSQSVFARSFQNQMGMSCTRYRETMGMSAL